MDDSGDFQQSHADFDSFNGHMEGLVLPILGEDKKPVYNPKSFLDASHKVLKNACFILFHWRTFAKGVKLLFLVHLKILQALISNHCGNYENLKSSQSSPCGALR